MSISLSLGEEEMSKNIDKEKIYIDKVCDILPRI